MLCTIGTFLGDLLAQLSSPAPVEWLRLDPTTVTPGQVGLTRNAPHPNAGLLFVEFMTSKEGQQIFQKANYLPARPDVPPATPDLLSLKVMTG